MKPRDGEKIGGGFFVFRRGKRTGRVACIRETEDGKDVWIPLSQCEIEGRDGDLSRGCVATLTAPERVLTEKGLL